MQTQAYHSLGTIIFQSNHHEELIPADHQFEGRQSRDRDKEDERRFRESKGLRVSPIRQGYVRGVFTNERWAEEEGGHEQTQEVGITESTTCIEALSSQESDWTIEHRGRQEEEE